LYGSLPDGIILELEHNPTMSNVNQQDRLRLAVIMAGGAGERFWPLSRVQKPKQLLRLTHPTKTLLEEAVERIQPLVSSDGIYVATTRILQDAIKAAHLVAKSHVFSEPVRRNTLGGIAWVAANLIAEHPGRWESITLSILLSDHKIGPAGAFRQTVLQAIETAEETDDIVTIGIPPTRPESGFGYIEEGEPILDGKAFRSRGFKEKPSRDLAQEYVSLGRYYWNSGMLFFRLPVFMNELENANPECQIRILKIADLLVNGKRDEAEAEFARLPNISIDYALLEKITHVSLVKSTFEWDDIGSLDALDRSLPINSDGNVTQGSALTIDTTSSIVYNDNPGAVVCTMGIHGLVVIVTPDAVLVCPKNEVQNLRDVTAKLQEFAPKHL
jgi:mannose-1-phosphate guanylyltransferase